MGARIAMSYRIDLTGRRFERLLVVARAPNLGKHAAWTCACDCGQRRVIRGIALTRGQTRSCGCLRREHMASLGKSRRRGSLQGSKAIKRTVRLADALTSVFGVRADTIHVDRAGARVVRGSKY